MWKTSFWLYALMAAATVHAQERGPISSLPPSQAEAERLASEMAMNDSQLQKGDIVVTDRGFFLFQGIAADGYTYEFSKVPNPVLGGRRSR
jgi:hypothetical protein